MLPVYLSPYIDTTHFFLSLLIILPNPSIQAQLFQAHLVAAASASNPDGLLRDYSLLTACKRTWLLQVASLTAISETSVEVADVLGGAGLAVQLGARSRDGLLYTDMQASCRRNRYSLIRMLCSLPLFELSRSILL